MNAIKEDVEAVTLVRRLASAGMCNHKNAG
jgi:hypothetical protein